MCNAHNHRSDCTCGWGGFGHLGRRSSSAGAVSALRSISPAWRRYASYTNPNARCPVCGCAVFFYQSPTGGCVFFDELGPPWPKHPCTDKKPLTSTYAVIRASVSSTISTSGYKWHIDGWAPYFVTSAVSFSPILVRLSGTCRGENLELFIRKSELSSSLDPRELLTNSLVQVKPLPESRYRISLLPPSFRPIELFGYISNLDAAPVGLSRPKKGKRRVA